MRDPASAEFDVLTMFNVPEHRSDPLYGTSVIGELAPDVEASNRMLTPLPDRAIRALPAAEGLIEYWFVYRGLGVVVASCKRAPSRKAGRMLLRADPAVPMRVSRVSLPEEPVWRLRYLSEAWRLKIACGRAT